MDSDSEASQRIRNISKKGKHATTTSNSEYSSFRVEQGRDSRGCIILSKTKRATTTDSPIKTQTYHKLHAEMGEEGTEQITESIKSRFYWPQMGDEIKYFLTKICTCVQKKRPNIMKTAAMQSFTESAQNHLKSSL